ncbi:MAG: transcriptional regulator [Candidatus Thermoplasmatota archaeon]
MDMRCEEFVSEYLPTVKAEIGKILYEEYDLTQVKISEILDITQPAVSQYLKGTRGKGKKLDDELEKEISEVAEEIYKLNESGEVTDDEIDDLMCEVCKKI